MSSPIIHMETVSAPTNIACIKYWGKDSIPLNTPINSSVSITLSQNDLKAVTTAAASTSFTSDRLWLNGTEERVHDSKRFRACVDGVRALASDRIHPQTKEILVKREEWSEMKVHVGSYNTFPTAAGLASSAAGYAALVAALAKLFNAKETYPGELSAIARQGSGSACRSLYGGFVAWRKGERADGTDSIADQIADEHHWPDIRAVILVISDAKKGTSSTSGMVTSVATSELLSHRSKIVVPERMRLIERAYLDRDFEAFGRITMMDSNQFHATCMDTFPPIFYMNDISKSVINVVHAYNAWAGQIRAAYTFDAGPNAVLYTLDEHVLEVCALVMRFYPGEGQEYLSSGELSMEDVKGFQLDEGLLEAVKATGRESQIGDVKMVYCTRSGPGPTSLGEDKAVLDSRTGLNIYQP